MFRKKSRILALILSMTMFGLSVPAFAMESEGPVLPTQKAALIESKEVDATKAKAAESTEPEVTADQTASPKTEPTTVPEDIGVKPDNSTTLSETDLPKEETAATDKDGAANPGGSTAIITNEKTNPDSGTAADKPGKTTPDGGTATEKTDSTEPEITGLMGEFGLLMADDDSMIEIMAGTLTGVSVSSNISGPPVWRNRLVSVYGGELEVTPIGENTAETTFAWYTTTAENITDGANGTYSVTDITSGSKIDGNSTNKFTAGAAQFGQYIYCIATLGETGIPSTAYKVISQPALIGDLIVDYDTGKISAPLVDDGNASFASADTFGQYMSDAGLFVIIQNPGDNQTVIESQKPVYDAANDLLTATFNRNFASLDQFSIEIGHDSYLGVLRASNGFVPTDTILPGEQSVVVTLSAGDGNGEIALTADYVQKILDKMQAVYSGKKIVLVMRGDGGISLPADVMQSVTGSDALYIGTKAADMTVNKDLLSELGGKNAAVSLSAGTATVPANTVEEAKAAIGSRPVVNLSLSAGGTAVTDFGGDGAVTVSLPYSLGAGENAADIVAYYIKEDGSIETITDAVYGDGLVTFKTNHFSTFAVGYEGTIAPNPPSPPADEGNNSGNSASKGGSSGGSGSSTGKVNSGTTNAATSADTPAVTTVNTTGTVNNNLLSETITEKMVTDAVTGKTVTGTEVLFDNPATGYANLSAVFERGALERLQTSGIKSVVIGGTALDVTVNSQAITGILSQTAGNISISATKQDKLSGKAATLMGNRPVYHIAVAGADGGLISDLKGGTITVGIAYQPTAQEKTGNLCGAYLDENGQPVLLPLSSFRDGKVIFTQNGPGVYGVAAMTAVPAFTDTANHWAKDNIDFAVSRGLITGTSKTSFAPDTPVATADFLTALGKLCGADVTGYRQSSFSDVANSSPNMPYIEWAAQNKIMLGSGGKFAPEAAVTREQMAVILANYAQAINNNLPKPRQAVTFADDAQINGGAKTQVKAMQQSGIIAAKQGNLFDPQGKVTRAEAVTMLRRFVELVIDAETARGFAQNDAGQWQYIDPAGKVKTDWLTLTSGTAYWFDDKGIMAASKWVQIGGKWYYFYADGNLAVSTVVDGYTVGADGARI